MTKPELMQRITDLENELADSGMDNRHIPRRRANSRRKYLGVNYLEEATIGALGRFYFHLVGVQKACEAEKKIADALADVLLPDAARKRITKLMEDER